MARDDFYRSFCASPDEYDRVIEYVIRITLNTPAGHFHDIGCTSDNSLDEWKRYAKEYYGNENVKKIELIAIKEELIASTIYWDVVSQEPK
jgi:hypothetical protein